MKKCNCCNLTKVLEDFTKDVYRISGRTDDCKECRKQKNKEYRATGKGKDKAKENGIKWRKENREWRKVYGAWAERRRYHLSRGHEFNEPAPQRPIEDKKIVTKEQARKRKTETTKKSKLDNKERYREERLFRYKNDKSYKMKSVLRCRVKTAVKLQCTKKAHKTETLIGCSVDFLIKHIESQFERDMNWDNHGRLENNNKVWNIEHIAACALFDLSKEEEQLKCFNWRNLKPMWAQQNISKGDKIIEPMWGYDFQI